MVIWNDDFAQFRSQALGSLQVSIGFGLERRLPTRGTFGRVGRR